MPPPIRYLNEPSLHEMRNAVMATNSTSSKQHGGVSGIALPVTPPSSSTSILSDVKQKDQQQGSPEMEAMPTVHKRGPMTEKAMEFLQFGKIVRKSSTSSGFLHRNSIPNKKSDASVTSLVTTSSTAVTVLGGHDNNNVVTQGASVTPSSSPATATPVVPAVANNGTGALTSSPTSSSTMPERRPSWTLSSISATGSNLFSGISPAPSPHSAKELSVGEIVAGNSCRASPVDSIHSQPPPPSPHSTDDPILQESRREMFMAVTSPTTFPLLPDEYDSNEEDDAQYITLKQQREAKRKFRNQRISRRFSASYTNSNPNNSQGTSTLDSIFNVKGHNGTAAVDSFIRLSVSESLDALSMDGHLKSSSMSSRIKPAVLDLTKLRDQGSLGTADSRDSKGSGGEESSRDRDASKRHSNGLGGSGQGSGHCSETERGSNHSLGERCESLISDEDTIMSASQSVLTSQTPIDIRYKRSTPIGRYTASKNIALHNMVGLNSSRRSKQGGGSNHRNLRPDSTSSDHSLQDSIDARMILGQQHQQQQRGGGGSGGNKLLPFMEESTRSRGDQSVVGNGGEGGKGPATSLVEAAGNSLARLSGRFSSPIRGNTSQQQSTSISPLKSGGERSNMDGMTSSPFSMNLHVSSRGETSSPLPPPPLPSGASPVIEKRRSIKLDTSNNDLDSHSTEDEQVDFNPSLKRDEDNIMSTFQVYPLKTLGRVAMELLNRQQLVIIKRMWKMLRDGVSVIKHGRSGAPKMKALLCDIAMTKLYWKPPGSKADPDMDDHEDEDEDEDDFRGKGDDHQQLLSNQPTPVSRESTGFSFLPHGRLSVFGGRKGRRSSTFSAQGNKRMIYFKSILSISDQCDSVVFKRSANKGYLNNEHTCTITMETPDRTLDIEVDEDVCQDLLHGLQILVTYYQSLLPGRHSSTAADVDLHYIKRPRNDSVMTNTPAYSFF